MALSKQKTSLIHVAKRKLHLSDDTYRDILMKVSGVTSSSDLDDRGFTALMDYMAKLGFKSTSRSKEYGPRRNMATPAQVRLIRRLWADYTDGAGTDAALGKWLARTFKVSDLRFVNGETAPKAIGALKAMVDGRPK